MRVLVVDDHAETRSLVARHLERASHGVLAVGSCGAAVAALATAEFDVIVLDVMLPDGSGIELCARWRAERVEVPILLLTARGAVRSRVEGLEAGADNYLGKPFALSELRARVTALGRRGPRLQERVVSVGPLVVDLEARRVRLREQMIPLTAKELAIVSVLASRRNRIVSRDELIEAVWGDLSDSARASLDVLVMRIRRKFGTDAELLRTVRGLGYALENDP
jgi:two-component system, OmpR family, response regulator